MVIKVSIFVVFLIIFLFMIYYAYNNNRHTDKFQNFMDIVLEKNKDREFNDYFRTMYTNTLTDTQLKYALDKIKNDTVVNIHRNFLSREECTFLIEYSQGKLKDSGVFVDNKSVLDTVHRTSKTYFTKRNEHELIANIKNRIIALLNIDVNKIEELQITKYDSGDFYKLHHDYIRELTNRRKYSVIIYLNSLEDEEDGGATYFPFYKQKIHPKEGTLIYFDNMFDDNNSDNFLTLHESQPIKNNKNKYIITAWSRLDNMI